MLDIILNSRTDHTCTHTSRRDFLRVGGLGMAGLSAGLRTEAHARPQVAGARARSVLLVYLGGGFSHLDTFAPKPDAPSEIRGLYRPIPTTVPGLSISEKLPQMAQVMHKLSLVRSGTHESNHHETAANWVLSGRLGSAFGDYPAIGAVAAHEAGLRGELPPYVALPRNPSFTWELGKSAFLGERYESVAADNPMSLSPAARRALAWEREPDGVRDRYGRTRVGQSLLQARRLVEAGVRFVTVNHSGWDHHADIYESLNRKLPELDLGLSALVEDLHTRGTLRETLLVVMSEFGRSPQVNRHGGRDHWAPAGVLLFAGAGVREGFVLGETDRHGGYVTQRPVSPADVAHTILDALAIDPRRSLPTPDGRPVAILDRGTAIGELFA